MRTFKLFLLLLLLVLGKESFSQTTNYQVYSLFVINIAKYSSWPSTTTEFNIVVFGKSKVYDELLKQSVKPVNGIPLKVRQVEDEDGIGQPHIIYISDGKSGSLNEILKLTDGKPVMIITEREGLIKKGADFSFLVTESNTLKFDVNVTKLEKRHIKVATSLSGLANSIL